MNTQFGDILSPSSGIVVQGCNAQGVMGSGLAKSIRDRCPQAYTLYRAEFEKNGLRLGQVVWVPPTPTTPFWIANGITQQFYGRDPSVQYVDYSALRNVFKEVKQKAIDLSLPVHYPKIGAGLGGGDWTTIHDIIQEELRDVESCHWDFQPSPTPKKIR